MSRASVCVVAGTALIIASGFAVGQASGWLGFVGGLLVFIGVMAD